MWRGAALLLGVSEILCHWAALVSVCKRLTTTKVEIPVIKQWSWILQRVKSTKLPLGQFYIKFKFFRDCKYTCTLYT